VGILVGFAPWIVYWVPVGNLPFLASALIALALSVAALVIGRGKGAAEKTLEIGSSTTFMVLTALTLVVDESVAARWLLPLSIVGVFVAALVGQLIDKPFMYQTLAANHPPGAVQSELFIRTTGVLTWMWIAVFAGMTVSTLVPAIAQAGAVDSRAPLSVVFSWALPFSLFGLAALASRVLPDQLLAGINDVERRTTFVAYSEATIDELYYLAQKHADREVGAGQEAYAVKVGGLATPLVGDESRQSWPSTYKVRASRHQRRDETGEERAGEERRNPALAARRNRRGTSR
jgi:hypothetical protein